MPSRLGQQCFRRQRIADDRQRAQGTRQDDGLVVRLQAGCGVQTQQFDRELLQFLQGVASQVHAIEIKLGCFPGQQSDVLCGNGRNILFGQERHLARAPARQVFLKLSQSGILRGLLPGTRVGDRHAFVLRSRRGAARRLRRRRSGLANGWGWLLRRRRRLAAGLCLCWFQKFLAAWVPPAGASAGCDGAGAGLPNVGGLDGAATHQPGLRLSSDCFAAVAKPVSWRMRRPAAPRRSWRSHRSRLAARRERRFDPKALAMVLGMHRI